ncbi:hypothetical protein [Actinomadura macra]|uniref:hypothetical protein n=1 Tax=Actinomadura macra TaxID=46164 RepID=UPI00082BDD69|nr:hypothetical protein [Actinomadura macra]
MTHNDRDQQAPRSVGRVARESLPAVDRAIADLVEVAELVAFLALLRDPTVRRPWREQHLDAYARAELDDEARAEQADRTDEAPGEHRDAARPDVLDVLSGVLWRSEDLAWHLSRAARVEPLRPAQADADPRPYLRRAAECVPAAVLGWTNGGEIAHWTANTAAAIRADLAGALALNVDGHTVKALCPWCRGGLAGGYTWRVRILVDEPAIVCESGVCQPSAREVGTWWRGCPVWRFVDWTWLARRLAHLDERRAALAPPPPPYASVQGSTGRAGTPEPDGARAAPGILDGRLDEDVIPPPTPEGTAA